MLIHLKLIAACFLTLGFGSVCTQAFSSKTPSTNAVMENIATSTPSATSTQKAVEKKTSTQPKPSSVTVKPICADLQGQITATGKKRSELQQSLSQLMTMNVVAIATTSGCAALAPLIDNSNSTIATKTGACAWEPVLINGVVPEWEQEMVKTKADECAHQPIVDKATQAIVDSVEVQQCNLSWLAVKKSKMQSEISSASDVTKALRIQYQQNGCGI